MKVNLVIAARNVEVDESTNDINIFGLFTEAVPQSLPGYMPLLYLIVFCEAEVSEFGQTKHINIELRYADGEIQMLWQDEHIVPEARRPGERSFASPVYTLQDVPFAKAGNYAFHIVVDGRHENALPLYVHSPPQTNEAEKGAE